MYLLTILTLCTRDIESLQSEDHVDRIRQPHGGELPYSMVHLQLYRVGAGITPGGIQSTNLGQEKSPLSINCIYTWPGTWVRLAHGPELLLLDEAEAPAQAPEALHHEAEVAGHHRAREGDVLGDPGTLDITIILDTCCRYRQSPGWTPSPGWRWWC